MVRSLRSKFGSDLIHNVVREYVLRYTDILQLTLDTREAEPPILFPRLSLDSILVHNLQELAQRVTYICSLETHGKLSPEAAYQEIKRIWQQLKENTKELGIGSEPPLEQF